MPNAVKSPLFFATAAEFRRWLTKHADTTQELLVGYYKVGAGTRSMTWPESVDEALCFGWIDGVRKRINEASYSIRFTPRKKDSNWSAINIARAEALIQLGRMQPAGQLAFERRTDRRSKIYSYERDAEPILDAEEIKTFKKQKVAWKYFESETPSYRTKVIHWILSAKKPETRSRRLIKLIESCASGGRML